MENREYSAENNITHSHRNWGSFENLMGLPAESTDIMLFGWSLSK